MLATDAKEPVLHLSASLCGAKGYVVRLDTTRMMHDNTSVCDKLG